MTAHWTSLVSGFEITRDRTAIDVALDGGRRHRVAVVEHENVIELSGLVATESELRQVGLTSADLWSRNVDRRLTAYVVTPDGAAWVTAVVPLAGLSAEELELVVIEVAREADRLEYSVAGAADRY